LITYLCRTAKARALYECTDGPTGQLIGNPANSDGWGAAHRTLLKLTVRVNLQTALRIWPWVTSDPDPGPEAAIRNRC
jgi:hypothetical protein